jgi:ABC-type nitrate/sulfonate/bicarbonate transport system ATPase subunit
MQTTSEAPVGEPHMLEGTGTRTASVEARGVAHSFDALEVLTGLDLRVEEGEVLGLVGPSGCGKSTLLELIAGLREPTRGALLVEASDDPGARLSSCVLMPQRDLLLPWATAIDNAALAPRNRGASRADARGQAQPLLERFGLAGFEESRPDALSGGMRQRVAFLRTLLAGKPVLLLDEPFASLDALTRAEMQEWLAGALAEESRTVVLVSHDVEEALYLCDRVVVLSRRPGRIVADLSTHSPRALPRLSAITTTGFTKLRERALAALMEGRG